MPEQWAAMRFDWNASAGNGAFTSTGISRMSSASTSASPLERLLARNGLDLSAVKHWVLHTGGGAVIDPSSSAWASRSTTSGIALRAA